MPNWCSNTLIISHKDKTMMKRVIKGYNENGLLGEFIMTQYRGVLGLKKVMNKDSWRLCNN